MTPRSAAEKKRRKRSLFELNLERMGLQLERVKIAPTVGYEFCSWLVCVRSAEFFESYLQQIILL